MLPQIITSLAAAGLIAAQAVPDKPAVQPAMDFWKIDSDMMGILGSTGSRIEYWPQGQIPQGCYDIAQQHGMNPGDFTVFNVFYDDCTAPWAMCHHNNAVATIDQMVDLFGRMPVGMRSYIRHFIASYDLGDGAAAFTYSTGDCVIEGVPQLPILTHEFSHSIDWNALQSATSGQFSESQLWQGPYFQDSATISEYGRTNWAENFADTGMAGHYDALTNNDFPAVEPNWQPVLNAYLNYRQYVGSLLLPGGSCPNRLQDTPPVNLFGKRDDGASKVDWVKDYPEINIIEPNPENAGKVSSDYHTYDGFRWE